MMKQTLTLCLLLAALTAAAAPARDTTLTRRPCRPQRHEATGLAPRKSTRRQATHNPALYQGTRRQLTILVEFSDRQLQEHSTLTFWNDLLNTPGYTGHGDYIPMGYTSWENPAQGSVHDYFYDQSYGQFDLQFDLYHVQLDQPYAIYGKNDSRGDEPYGLVVVDAVQAVAPQVADWSPYDWDGDGEVEQVLIIYAGKGENDLGGESDPSAIWAHQWELSETDYGPQQVGGYTIDSYCCTPELDGGRGYGCFGVLCHEFSHCFGLPDLYDASTGRTAIGSWSVMDFGLYAGNGFHPCGYSAYERAWMGWIVPEVLASPTTVSALPALSESATAYQIVNDNHPDEYYLIEHRRLTGWDEYLPGEGVLIWHVDYSAASWYDNTVNSSSHYRLAPIAANNSKMSRANWAYPYQANDSLTNTSKPAATLYNANVDGQKLMSKPVTHIQTDDATASFDFMGGQPTGIRPVGQSGDLQSSHWYDLQGRPLAKSFNRPMPQGLYIVRQGNSTKKMVKP